MTGNWFGRRQWANTPPPRRGRLRVECLEDRSVPSTFTANSTIDSVIPGDGHLSLREAITKANTTPGADVIVVPAGVFKITFGSAGENLNFGGDFDIADSMRIQGAGAGRTVVDGQQLDRVFDVIGSSPSSIKVVLQGLTIRSGKVTGGGGGIQVADADLVVRDCAVSENRASLTGGGISNGIGPGTGNVTLVRTTVGRNVAGGDGGGLWVNGVGSALTVKDSTVRRNLTASNGGGIKADTATLTNSHVNSNTAVSGSGGGFVSFGTATLTKSTFSSNSSGGLAGGVFASKVTLTDCIISGNTTVGSAGGILADTATLTNSTLSGNSAGSLGGGGMVATTSTLTNCTISGNSAVGKGGGISSPTSTLTNCTISGNTAATEGGGVWATTATLVNCTVVENSAHTGGGLFHNPGGTFSVKNTIVALNIIDFNGTGPDVSGTFTNQGHNLIGVGGGGFVDGVNGNIVGTDANPIDPKLGPLANNGGRTKTHALKAGSPAIDHGDNAGVPVTDQRGQPRKKDGNGDGLAIADIGAYER